MEISITIVFLFYINSIKAHIPEISEHQLEIYTLRLSELIELMKKGEAMYLLNPTPFLKNIFMNPFECYDELGRGSESLAQQAYITSCKFHIQTFKTFLSMKIPLPSWHHYYKLLV